MSTDDHGQRREPTDDDTLYPIPSWVASEDRRRWVLAEGCARHLFADDPGAVWAATRSIFRSDVPTGPGEASEQPACGSRRGDD
jgi:hypothetical protein